MTTEDAAQLRRLEEALWRAETQFNLEHMERILAPDFFKFGRSGRRCSWQTSAGLLILEGKTDAERETAKIRKF